MDDKLVAACQMFLIPATILVAALTASATEALKTFLCLIGAVVGAAWVYRLYSWEKLSASDARAAYTLAILFLAAFLLAGIVHFRLWLKELNGKACTAFLDWLKPRRNANS